MHAAEHSHSSSSSDSFLLPSNPSVPVLAHSSLESSRLGPPYHPHSRSAHRHRPTPSNWFVRSRQYDDKTSHNYRLAELAPARSRWARTVGCKALSTCWFNCHSFPPHTSAGRPKLEKCIKCHEFSKPWLYANNIDYILHLYFALLRNCYVT